MKKLIYVLSLIPVLAFAIEDIDVAMYDQAYDADDIHVAMYDEAYPTNEQNTVAMTLAYIESLPPTAAGPLKELSDCNDY